MVRWKKQHWLCTDHLNYNGKDDFTNLTHLTSFYMNCKHFQNGSVLAVIYEDRVQCETGCITNPGMLWFKCWCEEAVSVKRLWAGEVAWWPFRGAAPRGATRPNDDPFARCGVDRVWLDPDCPPMPRLPRKRSYSPCSALNTTLVTSKYSVCETFSQKTRKN